MQVSLDQQLCLQEINNIGSTTYQNVCNGQLTTVPWGVGDWLVGSALFFVFGVLFLILAGVTLSLLSEMRR